jgi:acetoin utilization protein AcuB
VTESKRPVPVSKVMTQEVRTVAPDTPLSEVYEMLLEEGCHHVPIVEGKKTVGMISSRDLVEVARERGADRLTPGALAHEVAGDVMSTRLQTVYADQPVDVAIERIGRGDIHALVVLDHDDAMTGIVTHHDLLRYLMVP